MNRRHRVATAALALIITIFLMPILVQGGADTEQFEELVELSLDKPEKVWMSDGITHVRNQPYVIVGAVMLGDAAVEVTGLANFNIDPEGNGVAFGTGVFATTDGLGAWKGRFSGEIERRLISTQFVATGTGSVAGTRIRGTYVEFAPQFAIISGEILEQSPFRWPSRRR